MSQAQLGKERRANTIGVTFHRKTDTFYHDYLHRGSSEYVNESTYVQTPLAMMTYMEYGAFVSVVPGDPWALHANQYAFEDHHDKFETHVQEIQPSPVVPYAHGFTMPTKEKDIETKTCFAQVMLRPHRCRGPGFCNAVNAMAATAEFLEKRSVRRRRVDEHGIPEDDELGQPMYVKGYTSSYVWPWKRFEASQLSLAEAADAKIANSLQLPVLQDCLHAWWLSGAQQNGHIHSKVVPLLKSLLPTLPASRIWAILRFAGTLSGEDGQMVTIAGDELELERVKKQVGHDVNVRFTSPGVHDIGNFEVKLPQTVVTLIWVREVSCIVSGNLNCLFLTKICVFSTALLRITACNNYKSPGFQKYCKYSVFVIL